MEPKLSIIVPIYNVELYLEKCIKSILNQTFRDFELILVNDGSKDNSLDICYKYKKLDNRVIVVNQLNGGVSKARNAGLDIANGEWIGFVDADDYIDDDFYETLISEAMKFGNAEIVCGGVRVIDAEGEEKEHLQYKNVPKDTILLSRNDAYIHFLHPSKRYIYWSPWDKIIRSDIAKENRFEPGRKYAEDFYYCFQCISQSNGIIYSPLKKYNYLIRPGSAIQSRNFDIHSFDTFYFANKVYEYLKKKDKKNEIYAEMNLLIVSARTIRWFYKLNASSNLKGELKKLNQTIRFGSVKAKLLMSLPHKILLFEAAYAPALFKIR